VVHYNYNNHFKNKTKQPMSINWSGVFPAVTTKFTSNDTLDINLFEKNIDAQLAADVNGIILGGTLGEASVLTTTEKQTLVQSALQKTKNRIPVILNIAEGATSVAIEQARIAAEWGVQGLMVLPPMRYKPDHREAVQWFTDIAQATPLPIMIYNNPVDYKTEVTLDMFDALTACNNIQAVKESTRDVTNVTRMISRFGNRFKILCGVDTLAMEELCAGADGWVAGLVCAFPKETVALYNMVQAGDIKSAATLYRWFMPLLELDIHAKLVQYIKLAETLTGIGSEYVRAPRLILTGEERENILGIINHALATRPVI
jgi:1-pyrroline-4-hydroxy-2-carboxylate deaminase